MGLRQKVERGNRVFPVSDKSNDVIKALEKFLIDNNVNILLKTKVKEVDFNGKFKLTFEDGRKAIFDKLVIATGGISYPATGSTGDGYGFARKLGHTIMPLKPSLVPMEIEEDWIKDVQGLSLRNVK